MTASLLRRGGAVGAALVAAALLAACSGAPADTDAEPSSGQGVTITAAEFPWSAATLTNAILAEVVARHPELGVDSIDSTGLGPAPAWAGAQRGDIDLLTEVALPNQQELADQAANRISLVHETYGGAKQGWFVPTYATQPGQPLAGLTSVTQLGEYAAALGGRLVDADPSFITTEQNAKRIAGYGLPLEQVTSSEAAQLAELRRAYERQEPILVYLYHPHWVFAEFELTQLEEPTPFQPGCFTTGDGACAMPDYAAWTAASTDLQQEAPRFYAMLQRFELPLVDVEGEAAEDVAKRWIDANPQVVQQWLAS